MTLDNQSNGMTHAFSKFLPTDELDFQRIAAEFYRYLWIILAVSLGTSAIALLFVLTLQPKYLTSALIQVHTQTSNSNILSNLGYKSSTISATNAQLALIKTRYILEPVIAQNNLNIRVTPHYFPLFGAWMARRYHGNGIAKPLLKLRSYAWVASILL